MLRTAAIALVLLAFGPAAEARDGAPDPSFGQAGSVSFAPQRFSSGVGVAIDAQGRILVGATLDEGSTLHTRAAVLRLLPDGTLDPAFGAGGIATIEPPPLYLTSTAEAIAVDPQGRIIVAGELDDDVPAVARLLPDGRPDAAFASGGLLVARTAYAGSPGGWYSVALAGSDIVLAGAVDKAPPFGNGLGRVAVLARIGDDGVPDAAFASGGFLELPVQGVTFASSHAVAIDRQGRIVLGLWRATTIAFPGDVSAAVARVTPAGSLDGSFGSGGLALLGALKGRAPSISLTRAGAIVALGGWAARSGGGTTMAARLRPGGQLDQTFATGGELAATGAAPMAGIVDCQGDLVVTGGGGIRRFGPDGRLDPTFGGGAIPPVAVGATTGAGSFGALVAAPGGTVVLSGTATDGPTVIGGASQSGNAAIAVARVTAACPTVDVLPPTVALRCNAGCRQVAGVALDDPVGHGVKRVLLGIERISGATCAVSNGRAFAAVICAKAATRLRPVPLVRGAFRTPALGRGRFVVRAVAVDRDGNRSRLAVRSVIR